MSSIVANYSLAFHGRTETNLKWKILRFKKSHDREHNIMVKTMTMTYFVSKCIFSKTGYDGILSTFLKDVEKQPGNKKTPFKKVHDSKHNPTLQ